MSDWTHDNEFCRQCGDELVESEWRYCCDCEERIHEDLQTAPTTRSEGSDG